MGMMATAAKGKGGGRPAKIDPNAPGIKAHREKLEKREADRKSTTEKREVKEELLRTPEQKAERDIVTQHVAMGTELRDLIQELDNDTIRKTHEIRKHIRGRPLWTYNPEMEEKFVWCICHRDSVSKNCYRHDLGGGVYFQEWAPVTIGDFGPGTPFNIPKHEFNSEGLVNPEGEASQVLLVGGKKNHLKMMEKAATAQRQHMASIRRDVIESDSIGDGDMAREVTPKLGDGSVTDTSPFNPSGQADQYAEESENTIQV